MKAFEKAFAHTMDIEGWYSDVPEDPGGETFRGISRAYWPQWVGWKVFDTCLERGENPSASGILSNMVRSFYQRNFWDVVNGDAIAEESEPISIEVFDTAVNLGCRTAVRFLQESLNLYNLNERLYPDIVVDGLFGPKTKDALATAIANGGDQAVNFLLTVMNVQQGWHYISQMRKYPEKEIFRGWFNRVRLSTIPNNL